MASPLSDLLAELKTAADPERAANLAWFFQTGKGGYAEGDEFLGIRVPVQRRIAKRFLHLTLQDLEKLLASSVHEHRFTAAELLVAQYERGDARERQQIFRFYLRQAKRFNNWDLVDTSAPYILGAHLLGRERKLLRKMARSQNIWERRMAIIATLTLIRQKQIEDTFEIGAMLLSDEHDLIHKAVGWALREAGRVSRPRLLQFIEEHYEQMPRTALRYAIEHFPAEERKRLLRGEFG
jgi:3-methyladenine DNA glycosylase AlkD